MLHTSALNILAGAIRHLNLVLFLCLAPGITGSVCSAQVFLSAEVISPFALAGADTGGNVYAGTAGQPEYELLQGNLHQLTQGFHQPHKMFCPGDYNENGVIETGDLLILLAYFGCSNSPDCDDINQDGVFSVIDLLIFMGNVGSYCSAL